MSRAAWLASLRLPSCALGARLFPPSKWAGLFPSAAYRRSAPPQLAVSRLTPCGLGCIPWLGGFEASRNEGFCSAVGGAGQAEPLRGGMVSCWLADFGRSSASGFGGASHEARRRMAVCTRQVAGSRTRPASREACRRAAVKPRPSRMSHEQPRALWARCGVKGYYPLGKEFWKNDYAKCC